MQACHRRLPRDDEAVLVLDMVELDFSSVIAGALSDSAVRSIPVGHLTVTHRYGYFDRYALDLADNGR